MLIDLGDEWEGHAEPAESEGPRWMRGLRPIVAFAVLLPALILAAAAPRPAPALTVRANLALNPSEELIEFSGSEIIVRDGRVVTVYEPDGRQRWRVTLSSVNDVFFRVDVARGRVLAMAQRMQVPRTIALDLATGARVWEFEGWAYMLDNLIFVASLEGENFAVYDAQTLDERWSARGIASHLIDVDTDTVLGLEKSGTITEYKLETGTVVRSGHIDLPPGVNYGLGLTEEFITVFFSGATDNDSKMLTFDRQTFAPRPGVEPHFSRPERFPCGPVMCKTGFDHSGQVSIVDSVTGEQLWRAKSGAGLMPTPAGLFAFPQFESSNPPPLELLDPHTGQRLASLEGWQAIPDDGRLHAAPLVLRQVHTEGVEGQTFIAGFDRFGLRVLGSVPHITYHCRYADWTLACVTGDRRLLLIQINSGRWQA